MRALSCDVPAGCNGAGLARGAGHNAQGLIFALPHSESPTATTQVDWRFCGRCNVSGPGVVNRLVGPPGEVFFTADDLAAAAAGGEGRRVLRFSSFGDYSVHYLVRRA